MTTSISVETASVKSLWKQWTAIVDLFARRNISRRQVKAEDYRALHTRLLEACTQNADVKVADFAQRAAEIARPWLTTESLNEAPTKILEDLRATCRLAEERSGEFRQRTTGERWFSLVLFVVLFVVAGLATAIVLDSSRGADLKSQVVDRLSQIEQTRKTTMLTNEGRLAFWVVGLAGGAVTAVMAYCVFRSPRQS